MQATRHAAASSSGSTPCHGVQGLLHSCLLDNGQTLNNIEVKLEGVLAGQPWNTELHYIASGSLSRMWLLNAIGTLQSGRDSVGCMLVLVDNP